MVLRGKKPTLIEKRKTKTLIFGDAGVGKTYAAIRFPYTYFIDVEGGANQPEYREQLIQSGAAYFGPEEGSQDFATVVNEIRSLATEQHEYKTLVIDSVSKLDSLCVLEEEDRMRRAGEKIAFGNNRKRAVNLSGQMVRWIDKADLNVILICHAKPDWQDGEQAGNTFDGWNKLRYELDLVLEIRKQGRSRKAHVIKSRLAEFAKPENSRFDWSYENFASLYGKDLIEGQVQQLQLAEPELVSKAKLLVRQLQLSEEETSTALSRYKVTCFEDLTTDDITKVITNLERKMKEMLENV